MSKPLEEIQDRIVEQLHAGEAVDQAAVLAAHPEHAEALKGFFRVLELVEKGSTPAAAPSRLGEFQILRELGRGGMGVVYEAEQLSLKRRVALKVLPPALGHDVRLKARFQREAEAAGRLRHPGIVPVISFGDVAGTPFFAMELVEGRSLARVLAELREGRDGGNPPAGEPRQRWALGIAIAMAEALAYAHAQGIVHRDVKPGNILLDQGGTPRLSDFGLAQDLGMEGLTQSGESFGSPRYMSPEQAFRRKLPVDQRSDIYSLGVTLYEMLTLRYPYEGATSVEYMNELAQGRVVPPRKADGSIPVALESVLLRALAKDPGQRYPDASAFAEDLKAVLEKRAVSARPLGHRWSRRASLWVGVAAGLMLLSLGAWAWIRDEVRVSRGAASQWLVTGPRGARLVDLDRLAADSAVRVELRRFISRRDPGDYSIVLDLPPSVGEGQALLSHGAWSVSIDGADWKPLPAVEELTGSSLRWKVSLRELLGDSLKHDSVTVRHRFERVQLGRIKLTRDPNVFTQTVFIYDELPADYPESVSDPVTDEGMRERITPRQARFLGTRSLDGGHKAIRLNLGILGIGLTAPVAFEVSLSLPGESVPFARGRFVHRDPMTSALAGPRLTAIRMNVRENGVLWVQEYGMGPQPIDFVIEPMAPEQEVQLLLDLEQGRIDKLRVVFEPSRTVARENSSFDRYWNGTIDVTVPLVSTPAAGR